MISKKDFLSSIFFVLFISVHLEGKVQLGIDLLQSKKFSIIKKKKVALLTNTSAVDSEGNFVLDIFAKSKDFQLKIVLLPEHNGNFDDKKLEELRKNGITIHCTHTPTGRSPLIEWLREVDVVVADMQDIGMRYYTHSSSVLYAMIRAFEADKEFIILDRPNPLGDYMGGPTMDEKYLCFLGPIPKEPLFHGMTIGEKANYVKNCGKKFEVKCNCGMTGCAHGVFCSTTTLKKGKLTIVEIKGWNRKKTLVEAGLHTMDSFIPMSPAIQNVASIFEYATISLPLLAGSSYINFFAAVENIRSANCRFKYFYSPCLSPNSLLGKINEEHSFMLKGCKLTATQIDMANGTKMDCLELSVTNFSASEPAGLSLVLLAEAQEWVPECDWEIFEKKVSFEEKVSSPVSFPQIMLIPTLSAPIYDLKSLDSMEIPVLFTPIYDLKPLVQQNNLKRERWNRLIKWQFKHIGNDEFKLFGPSNSPQTVATLIPNKTSPTPIRDLKNLTLVQRKDLRKAKWDRLTKLQRELIAKHIGDDEFVSNLFSGESIDVIHFRNKWSREATSFYNKTKKYYFY
ncbi:MAG: DUF1343 domain-containing protein [Puniceicoccales bacterium]|jgi:uncharacterized protein YbbC (DUF1343 family)|nr:DUF1343 domain-containing protein [Puniceicoccales bacterium]